MQEEKGILRARFGHIGTEIKGLRARNGLVSCVQIDKTLISTSFLCGLHYPLIKDDENEHFPSLVLGGNTDPKSLYHIISLFMSCSEKEKVKSKKEIRNEVKSNNEGMKSNNMN